MFVGRKVLVAVLVGVRVDEGVLLGVRVRVGTGVDVGSGVAVGWGVVGAQLATRAASTMAVMVRMGSSMLCKIAEPMVPAHCTV
jgi:hypothetical protein